MRKKVLFIAVFICVAAMGLAGQVRPFPTKIKTYELYSWQDSKGGWTFSLFPAISARISPDEIMRPSSALAGQEKLKQAIADLPPGSEIIWLDHALGMWKNAKGQERIKYPAPEVIADIRTFCERRGDKLSVEQTKEPKTK